MDEGVSVTHPNLRGVRTPTAPDGITDSSYEQGQDPALRGFECYSIK